jgi:hypothetical protein
VRSGEERPGDRLRRLACGLAIAAALVRAAGVARGDAKAEHGAENRAENRANNGAYVAESFGVATGRGRLGSPLHLRIGIGMRLGHVAIEPWFMSDLQTDRIGAFKGIVGGDPAPGSADLHAMGLDAKYIIALDRRLEVFVRAGPSIGDGNGALAGYHGRGAGGAGGAQLSGKVRALGFLWSPLFFLHRGPMVTGALFLDAGYDLFWLRRSGGAAIDARVGHVSIGFAVGSAF